jgi:hypothetical protein
MVTGLGNFSPTGRMLTLGSYSSTPNYGLLISTVKATNKIHNRWVWLRFWRFFLQLIWSPCCQPTFAQASCISSTAFSGSGLDEIVAPPLQLIWRGAILFFYIFTFLKEIKKFKKTLAKMYTGIHSIEILKLEV